MTNLPPEIDLRKTLVPWVGKTGKLIGLFIMRKLHSQQFDLTGKQWILLRILSQEEGRQQNDLALITDRDKASLMRLINTMERKGLVRRERDQRDRRVNNVFLTEQGRELYQSTLPTVLEAFSVLQENISQSEIEQVIQVMEKMLHNIQKHELSNPSI